MICAKKASINNKTLNVIPNVGPEKQPLGNVEDRRSLEEVEEEANVWDDLDSSEEEEEAISDTD